jgi:hypothetical protein
MTSNIGDHDNGRIKEVTFYQQAGPVRHEHLSEAWRYS